MTTKLSELVADSTAVACSELAMAVTPLEAFETNNASELWSAMMGAYGRLSYTQRTLELLAKDALTPLKRYIAKSMADRIALMTEDFYKTVMLPATPIEVGTLLHNMEETVNKMISRGMLEIDVDEVKPEVEPLTHSAILSAINWDEVDLSNPAGLAFRNYTLNYEGNAIYGPYAVYEHLVKGSTFTVYAECRECYKVAMFIDNNLPWGGPAHYFSQNCKSGKRPHCTCDTCF